MKRLLILLFVFCASLSYGDGIMRRGGGGNTANLKIYNVLDYGAVGNGVASDSASIQTAINTAYAVGGGVVYIPSGTYIANVKIKSRVKLRGAGFNLTTLKSRAGSNRAVVQSDSFYTWTGTSTFGGNVDFEISHMTIDANKASNPDSGYGVRVYGKRFKIFDVTIQNAKKDGLYTEWGGVASYNNPSEDQEAFVGRIKTIFNDGNGWRFDGPGDIEVSGMLSYQNKAWGIKVMSPMHLSQYNGYLNDTGAVHICYSGVIFGSDIHATTATGWGMLIDAGVGCNSISDISATGPIGVEIRAVGQVITGIVQNTTDTGVKIDGGSANLIITMTGNSGYWFDLANVGGTNNVIVSAQNGADGTLFKPAQYPGPYDTWFVGGAPSGYAGWRFKPPQDKIYVNGYEPILPATNDTLLANTVFKIRGDSGYIGGLPTYADDTAAGTAGLTSGMLYKTSAGVLMVKN
jgi:hypothetical protein